MKFKVKTSDLVEGIRLAQRGVAKSTGSSMLEGILFEAQNNQLTLYSTDLRISLKTIVDAVIFEEGRYVLNTNIISEIAKKVKGDYCEIEVDKEELVTIKSDRAILKFVALKPMDYPDFPQLVEDASVEIEGELFKEMIQNSKISVSLDENRLIYTGIKFETKKDKLIAVALDGYRISITEKPAVADKEISFIVPSNTLYDVEKMVGDEKLLLRINDSHAMISFGKTDIYTRLFEGEFFNYDALVKTNTDTSIKVSRNGILGALDRSLIIAKTNLNMVRLDITKNNINLKSKGTSGETNDDVDIENEGKNLLIAFNPKYLKDGIGQFKDEYIKMHFTDNSSPVTIQGTENKDFLYIVLPVRLQ